MIAISKKLWIKEYYFTYTEKISQFLFLLMENIIKIRKNSIFKKWPFPASEN